MHKVMAKFCEEAFEGAYSYINAGDREKKVNFAILLQRFANYSKRRGPRVGYLLRTENGFTRFAYDWGGFIQAGGCGKGFYLDDHGVSYSGGLDLAIPKAELLRVKGRARCTFWFFRGNQWAANNAIHINLPVRIYERRTKPALPFGVEEYKGHGDAIRYIFKINGAPALSARGHVRQFKTAKSAEQARLALQNAGLPKWKGFVMFTKASVKAWMLSHVCEYEDLKTGEICVTQLAEAAAENFAQNHMGGSLDDDQHWIWELAASVADECERA